MAELVQIFFEWLFDLFVPEPLARQLSIIFYILLGTFFVALIGLVVYVDITHR